MGLFDKLKSKVSSALTAVSETFSFDRLKDGLEKTRTSLVKKLSILVSGRTIDSKLLEEIEEILLGADIGFDTTERIIANVKVRVKKEGIEDAEKVIELIKEEIADILITSPSASADAAFAIHNAQKPFTILVIGVNGVGKTTTIGKLSNNYKKAGKNVIIGAADTFRAAANEQLEVWAERAGVEIVQQKHGADPAAVAYDTLNAAVSRNHDVCIIDTAGRLHNKTGLMQELEKITRVMRKIDGSVPHEVYLVLDATTGQNAILQAKEFSKVAPVTGLILTKLDGTSKGGVVIAIAAELKMPVRYIGVGEQIDDLQPFDPIRFTEALFETTSKEEVASEDNV